jgi:Zn-dependent protease with chaperone function
VRGSRAWYLPLLLLAVLATGCASTRRHESKSTNAEDDERHALWASRFGGTTFDARSERVADVCSSLVRQTVHGSLTPRVLGTDRPVAYSFPDGSLFVSAGLVDLLDDVELTAVVAHEVGHLLADRHLQPISALSGNGSGPDVEARADATACQLLARAGQPTDAMSRALSKVAYSPLTPERGRKAILARCQLLSSSGR